MPSGLRITERNGTILMGVDDQIARVRYDGTVNPNITGSVALAGTTGKLTYPFSIPIQTSRHAHNVCGTGYYFTWTHKSSIFANSGSSLVGFVILD